MGKGDTVSAAYLHVACGRWGGFLVLLLWERNMESFIAITPPINSGDGTSSADAHYDSSQVTTFFRK